MFFSVGAWLPTTTCASSLRILSFQTHTSSTLGPKRSEPARWMTIKDDLSSHIDPLQTIEKYNNLNIASFTRESYWIVRVCVLFWEFRAKSRPRLPMVQHTWLQPLLHHHIPSHNHHESNQKNVITPIQFHSWAERATGKNFLSISFSAILSISDPYCSRIDR